MLTFLDTEFTDLLIRPQLLAVGLVEEHGLHREFYAEVTDKDRLLATSSFGRSAVLPQFGKIAGAACSYEKMGEQLSAFLGDLAEGLKVGEFIELAHGYHLDWELVDQAIKDCRAKRWESVRRRVRPVNVYQITGFNAGKLASEAYFRSQALAPISRHHALCDARALRVAYEASQQVAAEPPQAALPLEGQTHRITASLRQASAFPPPP